MKALFADIRKGDLEAVKARLEKDPSLVSAIATPPPKKDAGQSPLQVAVKVHQFGIAQFLMDHNADVTFIDNDPGTEWHAPVLNDAVMAAVLCSRWLRPAGFDQERERAWALVYSKEVSDAAFAVVERMLAMGADPNTPDSFGTTALLRAVFDAKEILPVIRYSNRTWVDPKPLNPELVHDLTRIFEALYSHGADPQVHVPHKDVSIIDHYGWSTVAMFLRRETRTS
jgi:ankyrin repeat protein